MKLAHSLLPLLLCAHAVPVHADVLTDFFPPDTKVVFGTRVHNLELSSVAQSFSKQAQEAGASWLKMAPFAGLNILRDIDEVMLCNSGKGNNTPSLIVVAGRFDVAKMAAGAKLYHDVPVLGGEKEQSSLIAFLDDHTILAGNATLVHNAIDHRAGGARIDTAFNDRLTSLRQRYDVWGVGERTPDPAAAKPGTAGLDFLDRFQFGVQLASGLELTAELHAKSAADLEKLSASLQLMASVLKGKSNTTNGPKFELKTEDSTVKLTLSIPEADLLKIVNSELAVLSPGAKPATAPEPPASTPETAPAPLPAPPVPPSKPMPIAAVKPANAQVFDKDGNTLILQLPGKK